MHGTQQSPHQYIESFAFETDAGLGAGARLGLIVLQTDQTIEHEVGALLRGDGRALYHARIANQTEVTPETLRQMEADLPAAAALLPADFAFDVIGYGCTSGATIIGESRVAKIIRQVHPEVKVTDPVSALKAALAAMGITRMALVTPYAPSVTQALQDNLQAAGIQINAVASFNQIDDFTVARITSDSIATGLRAIGKREDCEAIFVSCTSLRTLPVIAAAEAELGKPVLSSNQVLSWHMLRLAGQTSSPSGAGCLFDH
ncbi:Asp/Glu racemase [Pararhodobacter oceanensis]|uniref:Asp/Glu racemase n=1 Tax=Pararhodobacter oceanensis TaxID=2172121 RepID=A0A2T8HPF2_9RHOB|nr:Asp/Glu racemase [Pararhodobacter oceanensis]PVH27324.1 Asp/Glu racemase [Pararhodobacter oceanensis]